MFTKLNRVLLASGLAVAAGALMSPAAFAGGGVAGSAAYVATGATNVASISTAAAVGVNGAVASSFNDGANTSAVAFGSSGIITYTGHDNAAGTITSVADATGTALATTVTERVNLNVGLAPGDVLVDYPAP
jgi:hypothetical protein